MASFNQEFTSFSVDNSKRVTEITVKLVADNFTGEMGITDIMLQRGKISTEWSAHPSEIAWTQNE